MHKRKSEELSYSCVSLLWKCFISPFIHTCERLVSDKTSHIFRHFSTITLLYNLINTVKNLLQQCAVTATTGKAMFSIDGCTIHSPLKLPDSAKGNKYLTGQSLIRLQNILKEISYVIIDEYSMLGQK